jgi:hypothetical protein
VKCRLLLRISSRRRISGLTLLRHVREMIYCLRNLAVIPSTLTLSYSKPIDSAYLRRFHWQLMACTQENYEDSYLLNALSSSREIEISRTASDLSSRYHIPTRDGTVEHRAVV